jgi:glycine C-acetyltransferase/8-amino-7-oxononanoate synthase
LRTVEGPQGATVTLDGREVLLLCSNNYLGLAHHLSVRAAAAEAAMLWGAGAGASRLISGSMTLHDRLERRLAAFHDYPAALLFGSGYLANTGTVAALAGRGEVVLSDELNHASIIDGCRLARAETLVYRHRDLDHLAWALRRAGGRASLIVTDALFSMDGDLAPLPELAALARRHRCRLMVDEAHAIGTLGPRGRGLVAESGLEGEVDVLVGTLGKALGSYGAYVCASPQVIELLVNVARPFIFSTAPPPPSIAAALAALDLVAASPGRRDRLAANAALLRTSLTALGLDTGASATHIVPLLIGGAEAATASCERALERGVFAQAVRPPTVPPGTSRLRLSVMATHRPGEMEQAARVLGAAAREAGAAPSDAAARGAPGLLRGGAGSVPDRPASLRRAA